MSKYIYFNLLFLMVAMEFGHAQVEQYSALKIGYDVSNNGLPNGVVLGVNGQVYIQDSSIPQSRTINGQFLDSFLLWVEKGIVSEDLGIGSRNVWLADYVFDPDYELPSLEETFEYVKKNRHLPGIIGQEELSKQGYYRINNMLIGQLKNLEELVLHTIAQEKEIDEQMQENLKLMELLDDMENRLLKLENQ